MARYRRFSLGAGIRPATATIFSYAAVRTGANLHRFGADLLSTFPVDYSPATSSGESLQRQTKENRETRMPNSPTTADCEDALAAIRDYLVRLRFGSIAITVHEGRIVQLDVTEKRRLAR